MKLRSFISLLLSVIVFAAIGFGAGPSCLGQEEDEANPNDAIVNEEIDALEVEEGFAMPANALAASLAASGADCPAVNSCWSNFAGRCAFEPYSAGICRLQNGLCGSCSTVSTTPAAIPAPYAPAPSSTPPAPAPNYYMEYLQDEASSGTLTWNNAGGPQALSMVGVGTLTYIQVPSLSTSAGVIGTAAVAPLATAVLTVAITGAIVYFVVVTVQDAAKYEAWLERNYADSPTVVGRRILEKVKVTAIPAPTPWVISRLEQAKGQSVARVNTGGDLWNWSPQGYDFMCTVTCPVALAGIGVNALTGVGVAKSTGVACSLAISNVRTIMKAKSRWAVIDGTDMQVCTVISIIPIPSPSGF